MLSVGLPIYGTGDIMDSDPTQYFRAMRTSPDRFSNLTDTQKAILIDLIHLLPFKGTFSGKSRYRAAAMLGRDRKSFNKNVAAILDWQRANEFAYIELDDKKGLRLIVDPETFVCGVASPIGGREPHSSGARRPIAAGAGKPSGHGAGSPNSKNTTTNKIQKQNQQHKHAAASTTRRELPRDLVERILLQPEEKSNGTY